MNTYKIYVEIDLGISHCGSVTADGESSVTLTPSQVETLKNIMEVAYEEGEGLEEFDLRDTNLEEQDPELYKLLWDAYYDCAYNAEYDHWSAEFGEDIDMYDFEFKSPILIPPTLVRDYLTGLSSSEK